MALTPASGWPQLFDEWFGRLKVMEPRSVKRPPAEAGQVAQVKWDGVRMLAFVGRDRVRLQNRRLRDRTAVYPEAAGLSGQLVDCGPLVLDGEFVHFVEGRPSFSTLLKRELVGSGNARGALERLGPVTYCVFDVLYAQGDDVRGLPWYQRDALLQELIPSLSNDAGTGASDPDPVQPHPGTCRLYRVESFDDVQGLWNATARLELEGIVVKERTSPYVAGKHHRLWWKCKHRRKQLTQVIGFSNTGPFVTSLALGALDHGQLRYIGNAGSGLTREVSSLLYSELVDDQVPAPPVSVPRGIASGVTWVRPRLVAEVSYLEWTPEGQLRHPVIANFPQVPLSDCVLE